jgi:predicted enzyme related to lactoylglutathione lyase
LLRHRILINFAVDDLDGYVVGLKSKGVEIIGQDDGDYGKFAWLVDPAGTKIELRESKPE